ncbi:Uncharacterised protein [Candidatus Anstonella stagnisolia]|nr:Uncharacterised protein [Candidatus Anstonella stagnisolia]
MRLHLALEVLGRHIVLAAAYSAADFVPAKPDCYQLVADFPFSVPMLAV